MLKKEKSKGGTLERFSKISEKFKNEIFEQCHSAKKVKGGNFKFFEKHFVNKTETNEGETFWGIQKSSKFRIVPKQNREKKPKGVPYVFEVLHVEVVALDEVLAFRLCCGHP